MVGTEPAFGSSFRHKDIHQRFCYLGDYFFGRDVASFARVLGVTPRRVESVFEYSSAVSISLLVRAVSRLAVRAEWLLCGTGPMLLPGIRHEFCEISAGSEPPLLQLISSPYSISSPRVLATIKRKRRRIPHCWRYGATPAVRRAAAVLFAACGAQQPVLVFSTTAREQHYRKLLVRLLRQNCVTSLTFTAAAAAAELDDRVVADLIDFARLGAAAGLGLGAALQRWAPIPRRSVVCIARRRNVPFTVQVSFGELAANFSLPKSSAEPGAVLGACAYVDNLVFAAQVHQLALAGGVFLAVGAAERAVETFISAYRCLPCRSKPKFTVVILGARLQDELCRVIRKLGGNVQSLEGDLTQVSEEFRLSCAEVFDGKSNDDDDDENNNSND